MKHTLKLVLLGATATAIGACSSGTTSKNKVRIDAAEEALRIFSDGTGDAGDAISNGQTLTARKVATAAATLDYGEKESALVAGDTSFGLKSNNNGELTMVIDGIEHAFAPGDRRISQDGKTYGYEIEDNANGIFYSLYNYSGEIDDIKTNGHGYAEVFGYQTNLTDRSGPNTAGFSVVGTETRDDALAALPSATYSGRGRLNITPTTGFESNSESRSRLRSDLTMEADFAAGTISGKMDNLTLERPNANRQNINGEIAMDTAYFDINGFQGNINGNAALSDEGIVLSNGRYSGAFYGGEAQEVGGGLTSEISDGGTDSVAYGYFYGGKD